MHNDKKHDKLFVNNITPAYDVKNISKDSVGDAGKDPFCIFDHQRHAVGSVIEHRDGSQSICMKDGSWQLR